MIYFFEILLELKLISSILFDIWHLSSKINIFSFYLKRKINEKREKKIELKRLCYVKMCKHVSFEKKKTKIK